MELDILTLELPMDSKKYLGETHVILTRHDRDYVKQSAVRCVLSLQQILDNYMIMLGYQNANLLMILMELMTHGKVRVEFRDYYERLNLEDESLHLGEEQIYHLFSQYLPEAPTPKVHCPEANVTQKIMVQTPKRVDLRGPGR